MISLSCHGHTLELLPERAIFWRDQSTLIVSDIHLGKATHFRKAGIPVPFRSGYKDLVMLEALISKYSPNEILILGDLFHSTHNAEWDIFKQWREKFSSTDFRLIAGNHDIIAERHYDDAELIVHFDIYESGPFAFSHIPEVKMNTDKYLFSGHIHPGIRLFGKGGQAEKLPVFYFSKNFAVMPAFGNFTGLGIIKPGTGDKIYAITPTQVFPLQHPPHVFP